METLEIAAYLTITIIVGSMILLILRKVHYDDTYEMVRDKDAEDYGYKKVSEEDIAKEIILRWEDCAYAEIEKNYALFLKGNSSINESELVKDILRMNKCLVIGGCNTSSNNLVMPSEINGSSVVTIHCKNNTLNISV